MKLNTSKENDLIVALEEYINFIDNESAKYIQYAGIHGMLVPDAIFEKGVKHRSKIAALKIQLEYQEHALGGYQDCIQTQPDKIASEAWDAAIAYQRNVDGARDISIPDKQTYIKSLTNK